MTLTKALRRRDPIPVISARDPEAVMPRQDIIRMLDEHHVPWRESWGIPPARTFEDFCGYHEKDRLYFRNGGGSKKDGGNSNGNGNGHSSEFIIDVHAAIVIVIYQPKRKGWLELFEDYQEFPDGHRLPRGYNGIAETLSRIETLVEGAERCLAEEIGFTDPSKYQLSGCLHIERRKPVPSEKWPGVQAAYHRHIFECTISRKLYRPNGYVEEEKDGRRIFFKWRPRRQLEFQM